MNVDTDSVDFMVKILRIDNYSLTDTAITSTLTSFGVDVVTGPETPETLAETTAATSSSTVTVEKKYFNVMDVGCLDVTVTLNTID